MPLRTGGVSLCIYLLELRGGEPQAEDSRRGRISPTLLLFMLCEITKAGRVIRLYDVKILFRIALVLIRDLE